MINDVDLGTTTDVPRSWLEEPDFDLVSWYRRRLTQRGFFEYQYYDTHQKLYPKKQDGQGQACCPQRHESRTCMNEDSGDPIQLSDSRPRSDADWDDLPELDVMLSDNNHHEGESPEDNEEFDNMPGLDPLSDSEDEEEEEDPSQNWPSDDRRDDDRIAK